MKAPLGMPNSYAHHPAPGTMVQFAPRVESISISAIRELFEVAGPESVNLGIGQPDFPTPKHVRAAASAAIDAGDVDAYTPNNGQLATRRAVAAKYRRDQGVPVEPERVILTAGGSEALHIAIMAHVSPGDEVIIPDPGFVSYDALVRLAGGTPVPVPLREDLTLDPAAVAASMTDDTVAFIINSPGNPTRSGVNQSYIDSVLRSVDAEAIADAALHVVIDPVVPFDRGSPAVRAPSAVRSAVSVAMNTVIACAAGS